MGKSKFPLISIFIFFPLLIPSLSNATYTHLLWEQSISKALNDRDDYYQTVGIARDESIFHILWTPKGREALREQLELNIYPNSPWYNFLSGLVLSHESVAKAAESFSAAMRCAESDPGATWVLFYEFREVKQEQWAVSCLRNLEKEFIRISALSAPVIAQSLLTIARKEHLLNNHERAEKYIAWSSRFERYPFWQTVYHGLYSFPRKPMVFFGTLFKCLVMIKKSWLLQVTSLYYFYRWFRFSCIAFICIVLLTLSLEYMPVAIHPCMEYFPAGISARLKYLFSVLLLASLSVFGFIPFILFISLILWPHAVKQKRVFLAICLGLIILSPVDARIQEMFRVTLSPNQSLGLFRRAISEGWHTDLEKKIDENLIAHSNDHLAHVSAAILDLKKNDMPEAIRHIQTAERLNPDDLVTLITAGNIYFTLGDDHLALRYYTQCVEKFPSYEIGLFNLGQLNLNMMNTAEGTEQLGKAAELNPDLVNSFIEKNADFFSNTWPRLRQFMQPDFPPGYFWKGIFLHYTGSWESTAVFWGSAVFGISPLIFLFGGLFLFILLITVKITPPFENIFFCKVCGNPVCRKCRIGPICRDCVQTLDIAQNEAHIKQEIQNKKRCSRIITTHTLNGIFPGTGSIYVTKTTPIVGIVLLIITAGIYGIYATLFTATFAYPFWIVQKTFTVLFMCFFIYNIIFTVYAVKKSIHDLKFMEGK